jgi:hypothetical protein
MMTFDAATRRIVLDSTSTTAAELWSRWSDWAATSDNAKYLPAFRQAGGDDLGGGLSIPPYIFLLNGWRVRPMEVDHLLTITGNLFVDGGGSPVVATLGAFNVSVQYTVPVQAQGISTGGGLSPTQAAQLERLVKLLEADEKLEPTKATKFERGTNTVLLEKNVTGGSLTSTIEVRE